MFPSLLMGVLHIQTGSLSGQSISLKPGSNRIGRSDSNDLPIHDQSISSCHCEITLENGVISVRDLGSTNGTFIDGMRIEQAALKSGQTLKLGEIEMRLETNETIPVARPRVRVQSPPVESVPSQPAVVEDSALRGPDDCENHAGVRAEVLCQRCHQKFCLKCTVSQKMGRKIHHFCPKCRRQCVSFAQLEQVEQAKPPTFPKSIPDAFKYPFVGNGPILLIAGSIFFLIIDILSRFAGILGLFLGFFGFGYLLAYMQKIIQSTSQGDKEMPTWPDFSDFGSDIVQPVLLYIGTMAFCFAPAFLGYTFGNPLVGMVLLVGGLCYLPMALLAVGMSDGLTGLNPLFTISSILKVPGDYLLACVTFVAAAGIFWVSSLLITSVPIPILPALLASFINLVVLSIQMRILGLLYYTNQERLGWV